MSRVWVVQEVALSPRCTCFYGHSSCDIQELYNVVRVFWYSDAFKEIWPALDAHHLRRGGVVHQLRLMHGLRIMDDRTKGKKRMPPLYLLSFMRLRQCSNPRNTFYGLRGMDARLNEPRDILVNYSKDVTDLYCEVTKSGLLEFAGALSSLALCHREVIAGTELDAQLPSWVPNWNVDDSTEAFLNIMVFTAGGSSYLELTE